MRRLRLLRLTLLAFLGAFALWIAGDIWHTMEPAPPPLEPAPPPEAPEAFQPDGPVALSSEGFMITQERGGEVVLRLQAGKMLGLEEGSRILSDILIEVRPQPDEHPDRLVRIEGEAGRFDSVAHEVELRGEIHIALDSGEWLQTDGLRYRLDQRLAAASGPVRFDLAGTLGRAEGLVADLKNGRIDLVANVVLEKSDRGERAARIHAESLQRHPEFILLSGAVRIEGDWGTFRGRELRFTPTPDGGAVGVSRSPGELGSGDPETSERFRLTGGHWTFELDPDRGLRSVVCRQAPELTLSGDDEAGVRLESIRAPEIRVDLPPGAGKDAPRLLARGTPDQSVVTHFASGPVQEVRSTTFTVFREDEAGPRIALFTGSVRATGEARQATGHTLRVAESRAAELRGDGTIPARIIQDEQVLAAQVIRFAPDGSGEAQGDVNLARPGRRPGEERLAATGDAAWFSPDGHRVRLQGQVRVWHGERTLSAGWLETDHDTGTLRAGETVHLAFRPGQGIEGLRASERVQVRAESLLWENSPRRVTFDGAVHLTQESASVEADHLVLEETPDGNRILLAEGQVSFEDLQWLGSGDRLLYRHAVGSYELESYNDLARVAAHSDAGFLAGRLLRFDREGGAVEVVSRDDGRATVRYDGAQPNR